jgi:hypothetical protein
MKYNPNEELTDEQLKELSEDDFFEYIDSKAAHLKQFTRPLESYHTKRFAVVGAAIEGRYVTNNELESAKKIGRENFNARMEREANVSEQLGGDPKYKDAGIKNIKTHRSQWFD